VSLPRQAIRALLNILHFRDFLCLAWKNNFSRQLLSVQLCFMLPQADVAFQTGVAGFACTVML
jgi:hypothetical protein